MGDNVQNKGFIATSSDVYENDTGATSASKPSKRVKRVDGGTEFFVEAFKQATQHQPLPSRRQRAKLCHLVCLKLLTIFQVLRLHTSSSTILIWLLILTAHAFMDVTFLYKISMVTDFVDEKFSDSWEAN